jgi:hypothetical protein
MLLGYLFSGTIKLINLGKISLIDSNLTTFNQQIFTLVDANLPEPN